MYLEALESEPKRKEVEKQLRAKFRFVLYTNRLYHGDLCACVRVIDTNRLYHGDWCALCACD